MQFHTDIRGIISSYLTIEDIPSLRACKGINSLKVTLFPQQAALFGWDSTKGEPLPFLQRLFDAVRSINYYGFCQKDYIIKNGKQIYVLKLYRTLVHLKNIPFQNLVKAMEEFDPQKFPKHHLIIEIIGLSSLEGINKANQNLKDRALMKAAKFLAYPLCRTLLQHGANPNFLTLHTPFQEVVLRGHLELAKVFLVFNASLTDTSTDNQSPLQLAVDAGLPMVELLLAKGATDNPTLTGTAFSKALMNNKFEIAKRLKFQAVTLCLDRNLNTYLHLAMQNPEQEWMLKGYDPRNHVNTLNSSKMTPLHTAVIKQNADGITYLLNNGASPNIRGILGKTPLELANGHYLFLFDPPEKRRRLNNARP